MMGVAIIRRMRLGHVAAGGHFLAPAPRRDGWRDTVES